MLKSNSIVKDTTSYVAQFGYEAVLKEAISLDRAYVIKGLNKLRTISTTALFSESSNNAVKVAAWLVEERKANVNMHSKKDTPLNTVARYGHYEVAEYLIAKGTAVNGYERALLGPPLYEAVSGKYLNAEKLLLEQCSAVYQSKSRVTPLHAVAKNVRYTSENITDDEIRKLLLSINATLEFR
ncbi:Ankyrin repeat [Rickettsia akari str. Hartford]|uniref:Ankyrin repeat n=1 Tax=Rickettsia akari (strain Hartford) TaxID=293614 RepID=A8GP40_RICAH|nr:ankyrin repeat domain-containing protein [Rickettsia akari]ABV75165.1 Ankyrin repeat [Rickettsia akari str. Hartford]